MSKVDKSVMKIHEWEKAITYRVACNCGDEKCDMTLDLEKDDNLCMIFLNIYKNLHWSSYWGSTNWFKNIWLRIKCALKVLFTGYIEIQESFIMREDQINGFIKALEEGKDYLKNKSSAENLSE